MHLQAFTQKPISQIPYFSWKPIAEMEEHPNIDCNWTILILHICIFLHFKTGTYTIKTSSPLGKLLLVKVEKDPYLLLLDDEWFCSKIVVTTPEGESILFPCYRWISKGELVELRGGKGLLWITEIMIYMVLAYSAITLLGFVKYLCKTVIVLFLP